MLRPLKEKNLNLALIATENKTKKLFLLMVVLIFFIPAI
jgi:hypothetical protein